MMKVCEIQISLCVNRHSSGSALSVSFVLLFNEKRNELCKQTHFFLLAQAPSEVQAKSVGEVVLSWNTELENRTVS